ncbi:MAG: fumarylacetoacetate hydrolase family protein, partial [Brevibacterium aurantiacum]|nr:fumarylacetoacetate hydrolase family protein [Brevibacterium aurantiacum]
MELLRLGPIGHEIPVVRDNDVYYDLRPLTTDITPEFFADDGIGRVRTALDEGSLVPLEGAEDLRIGAPVARPSAVVCVGMNYAAHAREAGAEPPAAPVVFFKMPSTIAGPYDALELPPYATKADWEVELGLVIGSRAF